MRTTFLSSRTLVLDGPKICKIFRTKKVVQMGTEGIEPSNNGLEPFSLPLAYAPIHTLKITHLKRFIK